MLEASVLPGPQDVRDAAGRLAGVALPTPLLSNAVLDAATGARILLKAEVLQHTGSFKFRGAYNRLAQLTPAQRKAGVVAFSSGNHAQGVAYAAALLGLEATIVMPADAPRTKLDNTKKLGAKVVTFDRQRDSREAIAAEIASVTGAVIVPSFDDPDIIAGQGTVGLEIAAAAKPDIVLTPCSGGGLAAGIALGLEASHAKALLYTVEPEGFDDYARSLKAGAIQRNTKTSGSLLDALLSPQPGQLTFAINRQRLAGGLVVSEAQAMHAVAFAFQTLKLVVEPGGAAALAALLAGALEVKGKTVAIVLSGGNIDPDVFATCLAGRRLS